MRKAILLVVVAAGVLVAAALWPRKEPSAPAGAVDLDRWRDLAATEFRSPWPTGIDHVLIKRIPNPLNRSFQVSVTVNGVSPCSGSGVCRR